MTRCAITSLGSLAHSSGTISTIIPSKALAAKESSSDGNNGGLDEKTEEGKRLIMFYCWNDHEYITYFSFAQLLLLLLLIFSLLIPYRPVLQYTHII